MDEQEKSRQSADLSAQPDAAEQASWQPDELLKLLQLRNSDDWKLVEANGEQFGVFAAALLRGLQGQVQGTPPPYVKLQDVIAMLKVHLTVAQLRAQELHDRATRGEQLTEDEQAELELWYAQQDSEEVALLNKPASVTVDSHLQQQVEAVLARLGLVTEQIQALSAENDAVRLEIAELRRRLAKRQPSQAA